MTERLQLVELSRPAARISPKDIFVATFARPAAIVAYAVPTTLVNILSAIFVIVVTPNDRLIYVNSVSQFINLSLDEALTLIGVFAPIALITQAFAAAAAALVITAELTGRRMRVTAAWRHSARLLRRTVPAGLLASALAIFALIIAFLTMVVGAPAWLALAILVVELIVLYPVLYVITVSVIQPFRARNAWGTLRGVSKAINNDGILARLPLAVSLAVGAGACAALLFYARAAPPALWSSIAFGCAAYVVFILTMVSAISVLSRLTVEGLSRQGEPQIIELPASRPATRRHSVGGWAVAVLAALLPWAVLAGSITLNPTNITTTTVLSVDYVDIDLQTLDVGSDIVANFSYSYGELRLAVCSENLCEDARDVVRSGFITAISPTSTDGVIMARWTFGDSNPNGQEWVLEVSDISAAELLSSAREDVTDRGHIDLDLEVVNTIDRVTNDVNEDRIPNFDIWTELSLRIDSSGTFPIIASMNGLATPGERVLSVYRCEDALCTSASKQSLTVNSRAGVDAYRSLDLAVSENDTAFVTLTGFEHSEAGDDIHTTTLFTSSATGELQQVRIVTSPPTIHIYEDVWAPSQIVAANTDLPFVLHQYLAEGDFELIVCADADCTSTSHRTVPGSEPEGWRPALAIDATGRPLIATYSTDGASVVVLSCVDSGCSSFESRVVAAAHEVLTGLDLAIDADGLPLVTIGRYNVEETNLRLDELTRIVRCDQPRCGAK